MEKIKKTLKNVFKTMQLGSLSVNSSGMAKSLNHAHFLFAHQPF